MRGLLLPVATLLVTATVALAQGGPEAETVGQEGCRPGDGLPQVDGTAGPDTFASAPHRAERLYGLGGDDDLAGRGAGDCLFGGPGADTLVAAAEGSAMFGESGADGLRGGAGYDVIYGGSGADVLELGPGSYDIGNGGPGDDSLDGGDGDDNLVGEAGRDELAGRGGDDVLDGAYDGLARDERQADVINGGAGDDRIAAGPSDLVDGGPGNDRIVTVGAGGADLSGGSGNDSIEVRGRSHRISAGSGRDRIDARNRTRNRIDCGAGRDVVIADREDVTRDCERVSLPRAPIAIRLTASPTAGGPRTRFRIAFTAPFERSGSDGSSFTIDVRGASRRCSAFSSAIFAERRQRVVQTFPPPRGGWCRGTLRVRILDEFSDPSSTCDSEGRCAPSTSRVLAARRVRIR